MAPINVGIHLVNILILLLTTAGGIALLVLAVIVLLKANKLLTLRIEKEAWEWRQPPPG